MKHQSRFWSGMPGTIKVRFCLGLGYIILAFAVTSQSPIAGFTLLVLPILWNVAVIWMGSESGVNFGPYRQKRETAFSYTLNFIWRTSGVTRAVFVLLASGLVLGGLGWISTEDLRAELAKPTLTERVATTTEAATDATANKINGWLSTAKGWFASDE